LSATIVCVFVFVFVSGSEFSMWFVHVVMSAAAVATQEEKANKPNIVWVMADGS
jgi:hypothetical protein